MNLREKLALPNGSRFVSDYFQSFRSIFDDFALINSPVTEAELVIHVLNGTCPEFGSLAAGIRARESEIAFEELVDKMNEYEGFLRKHELATENIISFANYAAKNNKFFNKVQDNSNKSSTGASQGNNSRRSKVICQ